LTGQLFLGQLREPWDDGHHFSPVGSTTRKALSAPLISGRCCCSGGSNLDARFSILEILGWLDDDLCGFGRCSSLVAFRAALRCHEKHLNGFRGPSVCWQFSSPSEHKKIRFGKKYHIPKLERIKNIPVKKAKTKDTHNNQSLSIQKPNKL